uniref:Uncharacterized protein n=1 Tax=Lotus japonicus TaxID=34305 RepID=I3SL60_LOTJA|nr:unknown [Lotus japonicus]
MRRFAACTSTVTTFAAEIQKTKGRRTSGDQRGKRVLETAIWDSKQAKAN